ncbi:transposase [Nocardia jiangxiensis]|uniref:transposase n=1 Tax=Nocardia jiangxiensis TaxID=282685 RepID=UPI001FDFE43D|nr:transposase [Nocardia jiangxiensis]
MTCSSCFARTKRRLEPHERNFRCEGCGFAASRDRDAARVVLAVAERGHVSVEDVRQLVGEFARHLRSQPRTRPGDPDISALGHQPHPFGSHDDSPQHARLRRRPVSTSSPGHSRARTPSVVTGHNGRTRSSRPTSESST